MNPDEAEPLATQDPRWNFDSQLVHHAYTELTAAGMFEDDSDYDGMLAYAVMDLVQAFSETRPSGAAAPLIVGLFSKLAKFKPLSPLTGAEDEWHDVSAYTGKPMWQNKRASHVFTDGTESWDLNGKVFEEPDGTRFTSKQSTVPVTFPYTPHTEIVKVEASQ